MRRPALSEAGQQGPGTRGRWPGAGGWWRSSVALAPAMVVFVSAALQAQMTVPTGAGSPPKPGADRAPVAKPAAVTGPRDLKYPPLRPIQTPSLESVTLPNGMRLYLLEDHELPLINGQAR